MAAFATVNPATGETVETFDAHTDAEIDERLDRAVVAFAAFRRASFEDKSRLMNGAADLFEAELPDIARVLTTEMGKTYAAAKGEVAKCAGALRWFAEHAEGLLADDVTSTKASDSRAIHRPLGTVLAIMPWNFPLWQVIRFAAPALMLGNVGVLKHAANVPQTALLLEDVFRRAGYPTGVFQTLLVESKRVAPIIEDDRVQAVTLTGSEGAGRSVAATAGKALKKTVLELGGSDPFIVLPGADLARAAEVGVQARVQNNGQSCIAAKRFIVHADVHDEFRDTFVDRMSALTVGDPMVASTEVGPLTTAAQRDELRDQVADAVGHGAGVLCGGRAVADSPGWFYEPTVLTGITPAMRVATEEVFGPAALLYRVDSLDAAIAMANNSSFGLGASVWTDDADMRHRCQEEIEAGMIFFNAMVASTPELPFGGLKRSGYGRELAAAGLHEFAATKTVWVN